MKKLLVIAFILATTNGYAQAFQKGNKLLNLGLGLNSYYSGGIPFGASFEVGINDDLSVGANVDYLSTSNYGYRFTALYFGGRGSYHFNKVLNIKDEKLDLYAGAGLGYRSFSWEDSYYGTSIDSYGSGIYLGIDTTSLIKLVLSVNWELLVQPMQELGLGLNCSNLETHCFCGELSLFNLNNK